MYVVLVTRFICVRIHVRAYHFGSVYVHACARVCLRVHAYGCERVRVYICACVRMFVHACARTYVRAYVRVYVRASARGYVVVFVCANAYVRVSVDVRTCVQNAYKRGRAK